MTEGFRSLDFDEYHRVERHYNDVLLGSDDGQIQSLRSASERD